MSSEKYKRARAIFERALGVPQDRREAFLDDACGEDTELRQVVERLLQANDAPSARETTDVTLRMDLDAPLVLPTPEPGERRSGPYRLRRQIGEGGMGVVWEAEQLAPVRRVVALKLIKHGLVGSQVLARFETERQALALMNHRNVAKVFDAGTDEHGTPYFAMQYIKGDPINAYCDRNNLSTQERLELLMQVCDGVQHAHQKGIIHRDLKPANVLVEIQDGRPVPRIIDFGVAKAIDRNLTERTLFTEHGQMIGTPEYMSPEQAEMTGVDIDTRTDVYSLGVMLYELLVGALPFDPRELRAAGFDGMRKRIREETPHKPSTRLSTLGEATTDIAKHRRSNPSSLLRSCRGDLDWITMKALEKDRTRRYASASELAADLRHHLNNEPVTAGPPSATYRLRKFVRRHRVGVATVAMLALAILLGFAGTTYNMLRAQRAERQARLEAATAERATEFMTEMFLVNDPSEARGRSITAYEVLQGAVGKIQDELIDEPALRGRLLESMGVVYRNLGLYGESLPLLERAVEESVRSNGEMHPETARYLNRLAGLLTWQGDTDRAIGYLERAERIQSQLLDENDPERGRTLNNLGAAHRAARRYREALPYFERAVAVRERALGPDHPDVAKSLNNMGQCYVQLGNYGDAEDVFRRVLRIREARLGPKHPETLNLRNSIGELQRKRGDYDEARTTLEEVLELQREVLGPDHPDLVYTLANLGMAERGAGAAEASRRHLEEALELGRRVLGPDNGFVLSLAKVLDPGA